MQAEPASRVHNSIYLAMMILKDLAFAFRYLRRNKLMAAINVVGLSVGISSCLVIFLIAWYELSFDRFQPDGGRIFRIYTTHSGVTDESYAGVPTAVAGAIRDHFTGLESLTNFHTCNWHVKVPGKNSFKDFGNYNKIVIAGPEYFEVFNYYQWVVGDPIQSLNQPFKAVISESRARLYFGNVDPLAVIGKEIHYRDSLMVTVSGIVKDINERTDLDFTEFISFSTIENSWLKENIQLDSWNSVNSSSQLFIKIHAGTPVEKIESQISALPDLYKNHYQKSEWSYPSKMQPLAELHFNSDLGIFDHSPSVMEKSTLQILFIVASILLLIAAINFINLETAQAARRAKEVGVRKVLGSPRGKLISQFLYESFLLCFLAVLLSVVWAKLSMLYFLEYMPQGLEFDLTEPVVVLFLISCLVGVTLLAGLYPAFILSSYKPAAAIRNMVTFGSATTRSAFIRKGLTVFQFSVSHVLIVGTLTIATQVDFMLNKDLGFDPHAVVSIHMPSVNENDRRLPFKTELERIPEIAAVSIAGLPPVSGASLSSEYSFDDGREMLRHKAFIKQGDTSYLRVHGIKLLEGRNLIPVDSVREYLINEAFMRKLGFTEPRDVVGKALDKGHTIVGVVEDFHTKSLHSPIDPVVISYDGDASAISLKLFTPNDNVSDITAAMGKIEAVWSRIYPDRKFVYSFLDDRIKRFYEAEQRTGKLASAATGIAIFISCLGLFALSSFSVFQRTKEIGIRKVFGATVKSILFLLSKDFLILVVIAGIISAPIAYYVGEAWLDGFAYRTDITAWIFLASAVISIFVAFITMSFRTVAAAQADPVKSLRYE